MLQCNSCNKQFKYESEKKRHEQSHVPQFSCKVCSKKFSFVSALRRHEKQHERKAVVHCSKCGGTFRDETLLKRHMQYAHKGIFTCEKCGIPFSSEVALKSHAKTHKPVSERQFRCSHPGCPKSFNFSHHLKHHELTHTDDKQHICPVCKKGFIQSHHLKLHIKAHDPEAWLMCTVPNCNKNFANEYARKRHIATHRKKGFSAVNSPSDSSTCDASVPDLVAMLCVYCGKIIMDQDLDTHSETCVLKEQTEPEDLSVSSLGISIKEISDNMNAEARDEKQIEDEDMEGRKEVSKPCKCKALLHDDSSMENPDSQSDDCFCEQVTKNVDDLNESTTGNDINDLQVIKLSDEFITDDYLENSRENRCETCECSNLCTDVDKAKEVCKFHTAPETECGTDGIIKIKETFDIDIAKNIDRNEKKFMDPDNEAKLDLRDVKCVQYNTCEDVLGKCIVSGSGVISDECLCAKMNTDNQLVVVQEIEELTPCPKKNTWFNIKYKVRS